MAEHVLVIGATSGGQIEIVRNKGWSVLFSKLDFIILYYRISCVFQFQISAHVTIVY